MSDNWVVSTLENALSNWNEHLSEIWSLVSQTPESFRGGEIWSVIVSIHDAMVAVKKLRHDLFLPPFTDEVNNPRYEEEQHTSCKDQNTGRPMCRCPARPEQLGSHKVAAKRQKPQFPEDADDDRQTENHKRNDQELTSNYPKQSKCTFHNKFSILSSFIYKYYLIFRFSCQIFNNSEVIIIEVKIPKEIRAHRETIFFGLSARQFICAILAVGLAAGIYLGLGNVIGKEAASWLCLLLAAPVAAAGFFHYNGMTLEQFLWAFIKSEILCAGPRRFDSVNLHEEVFANIMEGTLE